MNETFNKVDKFGINQATLAWLAMIACFTFSALQIRNEWEVQENDDAYLKNLTFIKLINLALIIRH